MIDNWAKIQSGLSLGHALNAGEFGPCVNFRHQDESPEVGLIRGAHCILTVAPIPYQNNSNEWNERFDWREV